MAKLVVNGIESPWQADSAIGIREVALPRSGEKTFEIFDETTGEGQWRRRTRALALASVQEELDQYEEHGVRRGESAK